MSKSVKELLIAARALIADPEYWCAGNHAIDDTGASVPVHSSNAYAFCADGALLKATRNSVSFENGTGDDPDYNACSESLDLACNELFPETNATLVELNDGEIGLPDIIGEDEALALQHANVLRVFDHAISEAV